MYLRRCKIIPTMDDSNISISSTEYERNIRCQNRWLIRVFFFCLTAMVCCIPNLA